MVAEGRLGSWRIRENLKTGHRELFLDRSMLLFFGMAPGMDPFKCYEYWLAGFDPEDLQTLQRLMKQLETASGRYEIEFGWNHPQKGHLRMRWGGEREESQGTEHRVFSGYCQDVSGIGRLERDGSAPGEMGDPGGPKKQEVQAGGRDWQQIEAENRRLRREKKGIHEILRMALSGTMIYEFFYYPEERYALLPDRLCHAYGFKPRYDELPEGFCKEWVLKSDGPDYCAIYESIDAGASSASGEFRLQDGITWLRLTMSVVQYGPQGQPQYAVGIVENITAQKQAELAYAREEQYRKALLSDTMAFYSINFTKNLFERCHIDSPHCVEVKPGDSYDTAYINLMYARLSANHWKQYLETFSLNHVREQFEKGETELRLDFYARNTENSGMWIQAVLRLLMEKPGGELKGFLYLTDIDRKKRREMELMRRSEEDSMTGVLNKGAVIRHIRERLEDGKNNQSSVFFVLDIDHFKKINDSYGHPCGDTVIMRLAAVLKENSREEDLVGRLGGDEFCIFFSGINSPVQVERMAKAVLEDVRAIRLQKEGEEPVTCSIGISMSRGREKSFEEYYEEADAALYQVKKSGRNGYFIHP